ncbi:YciI family protein [Propionibacteriaceae bacterium Y2011]|uniref:YciI family protein n=1 Tax=Microlunatus sp. Y2014 TaxID=3418488 RepID=UPI003B460E1C
MKYILLVMGFREGEGMPVPPTTGEPNPEEFDAYVRETERAGVSVDWGVAGPYEEGTSVQVDPTGERLVTNGPFAESREYLGGWNLIDVPDLDAALEWAGKHPGAKYGRIEVRPWMKF